MFAHKLISRCSFHFFLLLSIRVPRTRAPYTTVRNMTKQERIRRCSLCLCHLNLQNLKEKNSLAKSYHPKKRIPPEKHTTVKTNCKCRSVSLRLHQRSAAHQIIITTRLISIVLLSSCPKDSQNNTSDCGKLILSRHPPPKGGGLCFVDRSVSEETSYAVSTTGPRAARKIFIAALTSLSWCEPHSRQVHCLSLRERVSLW